MSLHIHRAERADRLVDALGELLSTPLPDPFASEIVSVPTPGVERWLAQRLSRRLGASPGQTDGICAGVDFCSPRRLIARAMGEALGRDPELDPWQPERAVWPLLRVIDDCRGEPWASLLWSYLGDGGPGKDSDPVRGGRRWSTARHLADLFAAYAVRRPAMITAWAEGCDVDGAGRPLSSDRAWQAELWRRLAVELGGPHPPELVQAATEVLRTDPGRTRLPDRVSVFGVTRLDPDHRLVLAALAEHRDVHLWLAHPSPKLWQRMAGTEFMDSLPLRANDHSDQRVQHRLLAYLGRDIRELQLGLHSLDFRVIDRHYPAAADPPTTLLSRLQADIAADAEPRPADDRAMLDPNDRSVQVHSSHGPDRQVEVLREVLVGLLADDPTLEPRDIVVMCPDIETYAPLIAAAFGLDTAESEAEHPGHRLRVRLADRSLRQINPLLAIVGRLVQLADSRLEAAAVLDLCGAEPVARKFGFSTEDLDRLADLVARAGIRWGLDATHRSRFGLDGFGQNTWAAGLDRLLLGVTMDESGQRFLGTALPLDDVDASDVDLVGRFAELLSRLRTVTAGWTEPRRLPEWIASFQQTLEWLTAVPATDTWQLTHAHGQLGRIAEAAGDDSGALSLPEVAALLSDGFRGRASRANFRTGTLTMCTMLPMRSVPHRVVCLLGADDGVFPRPVRPDGDDLTEPDPMVGDRDPRSEDRQLLLDALLAAEEQLVVIIAGTDPRTGADIPPAVPIGALLDALDSTARTPTGRRVRDQITIKHPLQPFDPVNFAPGRLGAAEGFSFDRASLRGVRAASVAHRQPPPAVYGVEALPAAPQTTTVGLAELIRFFHHPARALLRERGRLSLWADDTEPDHQIPAELGGLERWQVGERLLRLHLQGAELAVLAAAEWRRGTLPPRGFGARALTEVADEAAELAASATPFRTGPVERREILLDLPGPAESVRLTGSVGHLYGQHLVRVSYSSLSAKHRLQSWIELLALTASSPERPWRAVTLGRGGQSILGPITADQAMSWLAGLIDLRRIGLSEPLPFAPKTSAEYARIRFDDRPLAAYKKLLRTAWDRERDEIYERFFGPKVCFDELLRQFTVDDEVRDSPAEPRRFGTLARRVFQPLLSAEELHQ